MQADAPELLSLPPASFLLGVQPARGHEYHRIAFSVPACFICHAPMQQYFEENTHEHQSKAFSRLDALFSTCLDTDLLKLILDPETPQQAYRIAVIVDLAWPMSVARRPAPPNKQVDPEHHSDLTDTLYGYLLSMHLVPDLFKQILDIVFEIPQQADLTRLSLLRNNAHQRTTGSTAWPGNQVVDFLVQQSSGQFIHPSTVLKFVDSKHTLPNKQLEAVLDPEHQSKVFSSLDALYADILSTCLDTDLLKRILGLIIVLETPQQAYLIADVLDVEPEEVKLVLQSLQSLLDGVDDGGQIRITHASLSDYLLDKRRSGQYFIDPTEAHTRLCLSLLIPKSLWKMGIIRLGRFQFDRQKGMIHGSTRQYLLKHWKHHFIHAGVIVHNRMADMFTKHGRCFPNSELEDYQALEPLVVFCLFLDDPERGDSKLITSTTSPAHGTDSITRPLNTARLTQAVALDHPVRDFFIAYLFMRVSTDLMIGATTGSPETVNNALRGLQHSIRVLDQECNRGSSSFALWRVYSKACGQVSYLRSKHQSRTILLEASQASRFGPNFVDLISNANPPRLETQRLNRPLYVPDRPNFYTGLNRLNLKGIEVGTTEILAMAQSAPALSELILQSLGDVQVRALINFLWDGAGDLLPFLSLVMFNGQIVRQRRGNRKVRDHLSLDPSCSVQEHPSTTIISRLGLGRRGIFSMNPFLGSVSYLPRF